MDEGEPRLGRCPALPVLRFGDRPGDISRRRASSATPSRPSRRKNAS